MTFDPDLGYYDAGRPVFFTHPDNLRTMFFLDGFRILPAASMYRGWFAELFERGVNVVAPVVGLSSSPFDLRTRAWDFRTDLRHATQLYDAYVAALPGDHQVTVVAHSWGAVAALLIAATRSPDRIVLVAPFVGRIEPLRRLNRLQRWLMHPLIRPCYLPRGGRGGAWNVQDPLRRVVVNKQVFNYCEHVLQHLSQIELSSQWLSKRLLGHIRGMRIDVLWGDADRLCAPRAVAELSATLRAQGNCVATTIFPGCGHSLLMDSCEEEVKRVVAEAVGADGAAADARGGTPTHRYGQLRSRPIEQSRVKTNR